MTGAPDVSPPEQLAQLVGVRSELATALATALHEARANPTGYPLRQAIEGALTELGALQKLAKSWRVESPPLAGPWKAQPSNATQPWRVWAPQRKVLSDLSREEALAVRDALNALGASKGTTE